MTTVCTQCEHFHNKEPESVRSGIWYNHLCEASPLPTKIDPYDGKEKAFSANDLGNEYFTEDRYQHCRSVNSGSCDKFQPLTQH